MSANTITKYIRQLEEKQLIDVESTKVRTKRGEVRNGTLQFTIRPIQDAVNYKLENDLSTPARSKAYQKKTVKTKLGPVRACVRFCGPGRERHQ